MNRPRRRPRRRPFSSDRFIDRFIDRFLPKRGEGLRRVFAGRGRSARKRIRVVRRRREPTFGPRAAVVRAVTVVAVRQEEDEPLR